MKTITPEALPAELERMADSLAGPAPRPAMERCGELLRQAFSANYDAGRNEETIWPPHAPATVARYGPHPLLILTGRMREATVTKGAAGNIEQISDRELKVGVDTGDVPYAGFQNWGTQRIPQREYLVPREDNLDQCGEAIADAFLEQLL